MLLLAVPLLLLTQLASASFITCVLPTNIPTPNTAVTAQNVGVCVVSDPPFPAETSSPA
jgi:hypothetical protein